MAIVNAQSSEKMRIEGKELIMILSVETGCLYLDEALSVYLFEDKEMADKFAGAHAGTKAIPPALMSYSSLHWECVALGAARIVIDGNTEQAIKVKKEKHERKYCNPELSSTLCRLLETGEQKYLEALGRMHYIIPVSLKTVDTQLGARPSISYGVVKPGSKGANEKEKLYPVFYLAFTDLDQFNSWVTEKGKNFSPIEVEFWQLKQIIGVSGICINPGHSSAAFLTPDLVDRISFKEPQAMTEA